MGLEPTTLGLVDRYSIRTELRSHKLGCADGGIRTRNSSQDRGFKDHCVCQFRHVSMLLVRARRKAGSRICKHLKSGQRFLRDYIERIRNIPSRLCRTFPYRNNGNAGHVNAPSLFPFRD